eukprot:1804077-Rhodomonas_salina.2
MPPYTMVLCLCYEMRGTDSPVPPYSILLCLTYDTALSSYEPTLSSCTTCPIVLDMPDLPVLQRLAVLQKGVCGTAERGFAVLQKGVCGTENGVSGVPGETDEKLAALEEEMEKLRKQEATQVCSYAYEEYAPTCTKIMLLRVRRACSYAY